ncbi:MAG: GMC family oxidoreductase, partial [Rickettsiales bacterium]|nr:GMC family oxidoreductase [Rickettsiales bacterium]
QYHALSQLTLTVKNRSISRNAIVIHLFGKNPLIEDVIKHKLPKWLFSMFRRLLLDRLYIGMCFLHSKDSSDIEVSHQKDTTTFKGKKQRSYPIRYFKLLLFFIRRIFTFRLLPIPLVGGMDKAGSSIHYGASVTVTDKGNLENNPQVYVADAASLPEIPAGSYTLTIMANAYRIGRNASKELN